jgi:hypothetical protein
MCVPVTVRRERNDPSLYRGEVQQEPELPDRRLRGWPTPCHEPDNGDPRARLISARSGPS